MLGVDTFLKNLVEKYKNRGKLSGKGNLIMKTCFALLALAAIVTSGCQSDIHQTDTAPEKYMNVGGSSPVTS